MFRKLMIASLFILSIACNGKPENSPETETGTNVEVVTVEMEFSNSFLEFSGVLQPISQVDVFPEVPGKIERIISVEGDLVQKGDILAIIEKTDYQIGYDQAMAAYALAKANWSNAKANYSRQVELNQDGFSSEANLEGAETAYKIAQAQLDQSEAAMQLATRQLERTKITSPIDGYISMRTITPGQLVVGNSPAYTIQNLHQMKLNLSVSETNLNSIGTDSKVDVHVEHFPGKTFSGKIVFVSRSASADGGFPIKVEIDNPDLELLSGWTASVDIYSPKPGKLISVPGKTVLKKSGQWIAFTVENGRAFEKKVDLLTQIRDKVYIRSGLKDGETIIVRGQEYCNSGDPVMITKNWNTIDEFLINNQD